MEQKLYNALCKFMEFQTNDYILYYDTPEQRFEYSSESLWLINPKTKKWVLELKKSGILWWYWDLYVNFQRYFNMERPDFEKFIKIWVEDVLNRGVSTTVIVDYKITCGVEDVLNRGVSTTRDILKLNPNSVEDVLNRGVSTTDGVCLQDFDAVEDVLNRGVSTTVSTRHEQKFGMEDVLNTGKTIQ